MLIGKAFFYNKVEAVERAGSREVRMMYLESLLSLTQLSEVAPELTRQGLLKLTGRYYANSPDKDIVRMCAKIMNTLVRSLE